LQTSITVGPLTTTLSDALIVNLYWFGTGASTTVTLTDTQGNAFSNAVASTSASSSGADTGIWTAIASAAGSDTVSVTRGGPLQFGAAFLDYAGVASFGHTTAQELDSAGGGGTSTLTFASIAATSWIVENFMYETSGSSGSVNVNNGQILRDSMTSTTCNANGIGFCNSYDISAPSSTFSLSLAYSSNTCTGSGCFASHTGLELLSGVPGTATLVTQCYGNCGAPAVTLVNTNSTHTVNFNQSITLFYEFQSAINGFILNVTTSVAKNYNNGQGIVEAIYTVPTCPLGQAPFTQQCPAYLASGWNVIGNPGKGKLSNGNYQIPISAGQWAGVSISGVFAPLDLNDTNTNVAVFQVQGGGCACPPPATITQAAIYSSSFKMGLWAWILGTIVTSIPPTSPPVSACAGLDCILTEATNSFCTNVTTACQTGSALFWVIILTIISITTVVLAFSEILPSANIGRMGIGELAILFFVGWVVIFTSFNLLSIYVLLLVFFVVAALSAKTVRGYVGI